MIKQVLILLVLFVSLQSYSQKLINKADGTILDSEKQKIKPDQVRAILADNEKLVAEYNAGRTKKTLGNVMLYGGSSLILSDMLTNLLFTKQKLTYSNDLSHSIIKVENRIYPSVFTYIGAAVFIIAIPVKIGFSKKIKNVVTEYNNQKATGNLDFNKQKLDLITNSNGIGLRLTLK